jgi:hypothetical protein
MKYLVDANVLGEFTQSVAKSRAAQPTFEHHPHSQTDLRRASASSWARLYSL